MHKRSEAKQTKKIFIQNIHNIIFLFTIIKNYHYFDHQTHQIYFFSFISFVYICMHSFVCVFYTYTD